MRLVLRELGLLDETLQKHVLEDKYYHGELFNRAEVLKAMNAELVALDGMIVGDRAEPA